MQAKTFEVEFQRVSYITVTVEAFDESDAESNAWEALEQERGSLNDAQWEVSHIEEVGVQS